MLRRSYDWIMGYSTRPNALWVLIAVAFAESSFFPIPPDPLYIAMILGQREQAWRLAIFCTLSSVIGGLLGYYIGFALYETVGEWIVTTYGMQDSIEKAMEGFRNWGFWIVALKGLTPIPYKIVTIASGIAKLDMATFLSASIIARGFRFFMLAALLRNFGAEIKEYIDRNLGFVTTVGVSALVIGFVVIKYLW